MQNCQLKLFQGGEVRALSQSSAQPLPLPLPTHPRRPVLYRDNEVRTDTLV